MIPLSRVEKARASLNLVLNRTPLQTSRIFSGRFHRERFY